MPNMDELLKKYKLTPRKLADELEVRKTIVKNLRYLMFKYKAENQSNMPQADLAELLGIGTSQLTKILQEKQTPTIFSCLERVKKVFGYSIDEFLYTDIGKVEGVIDGVKDDLPVASYMKFYGLYQLYYFDTSSFKGRERNSNGDAIKSGIMYVEKDSRTDKHNVIALFNMHKDRADEFYKKTLSRGQVGMMNCKDILISMSGSYHVYCGELNLSSKHVFINLKFENSKDRVQMIFHRPESNSNQYIGGLGTMVSVSKGRNAAPCLQYIALANESLDVSEEELASHMLMHYPNIKTYETIDDLVDFTVNLYSPEMDEAEQMNRLSDEQKKSLVRNYVDKIVNDTVEKNLFRTVVVSPADDDEFYHYIKRVKGNMRAEVR